MSMDIRELEAETAELLPGREALGKLSFGFKPVSITKNVTVHTATVNAQNTSNVGNFGSWAASGAGRGRPEHLDQPVVRRSPASARPGSIPRPGTERCLAARVAAPVPSPFPPARSDTRPSRRGCRGGPSGARGLAAVDRLRPRA